MELNLPPLSRIILGTIKSRQKLNLFYLNGKVDIDSCKLHVNNDLLFNDSNVLNDQQKKKNLIIGNTQGFHIYDLPLNVLYKYCDT